MMRWGMWPAGRVPPSGLLFNARNETVSEGLTFWSTFERPRCLTPDNGFFEQQPRWTASRSCGYT